MMGAVRRMTLALVLGLGLAAGLPASGGDAAAPPVHTLLSPAQVASPGGLAVDAAGDMFVADTGHCRVLVLPRGPRCSSGFASGRGG